MSRKNFNNLFYAKIGCFYAKKCDLENVCYIAIEKNAKPAKTIIIIRE